MVSSDRQQLDGRLSLTFITAFLICMPFLKILPFSAEAQPLFLVPMLFVLFRSLRFQRFLIFYLVILFFFTFTGFSRYDAYSVFASFVAIFTPLITFYYVRNFDSIRLSKYILVFQFLFLLVALIQEYFPPSVSASILYPLNILIPRLTTSPLSEFQRGISIVASEPSAMTPLIFMTFALSYYLYVKKEISKFYFFLSSLISIYLGILTMALTFFITVFYIVFGIGAFYFLRLSPLRIIYFSFFSAVIAISLYFTGAIPERFIELVNVLFPLNLDFFVVLNEASGSRIGITLGPYCNFFNFGEYFYALGAWSENFLNSTSCLPFELEKTGFFVLTEAQNIKPISLPSLLLVDIGFFAILIFIVLLIFLFRSFVVCNRSRQSISFGIISTCIASIFIGGFPLSMPHFWIVLVIFLKELSIVGNDSPAKV